MQKWLGTIIVLLLLSSCGTKEDKTVVVGEKPSDLIPEDKMIKVLVDVHLLESGIGVRVPHGGSRAPFMISPTQNMEMPTTLSGDSMPYYDIFAKHGYTRDQFERSVQWYALDAAHFSIMYDEVINELTRRQAQEQQGAPKTPVPDTTSAVIPAEN